MASIPKWLLYGAGALVALAFGFGTGTALEMAYENGAQLGPIELVTLQGKLVEKRMAQALQAMIAAAKADGITLTIDSGFRTMGEQILLYAKYLAGGTLAARPGYSNHQNGKAVDLSVRSSNTSPEYRWLAANGARFGFKNTGASFSQPEFWHWEWDGTMPSGSVAGFSYGC